MGKGEESWSGLPFVPAAISWAKSYRALRREEDKPREQRNRTFFFRSVSIKSSSVYSWPAEVFPRYGRACEGRRFFGNSPGSPNSIRNSSSPRQRDPHVNPRERSYGLAAERFGINGGATWHSRARNSLVNRPTVRCPV